MEALANKQLPYIHYIKNHLPEPFWFCENFMCYPAVYANVKDTKVAKQLFEREFVNRFSEEKVDIGIYDGDDKEIILAFDLPLLTEEETKQCLQLAYNVLLEGGQLQ